MENDSLYFARRAEEERLAAEVASNAEARNAHRELAARYADLAGAIERSNGTV